MTSGDRSGATNLVWLKGRGAETVQVQIRKMIFKHNAPNHWLCCRRSNVGSASSCLSGLGSVLTVFHIPHCKMVMIIIQRAVMRIKEVNTCKML